MNIVFDLGGVVFTWNPQKLISNVFEDKLAQRRVMEEVIGQEEWVELDRGTIEIKDAIESIVDRTGLSKLKIKELMSRVPSSLQPIVETVELIKVLKEKGTKLYILSNMHTASIEYLEKNNSFLDLFDGQIISCRINLVKPEVQIYEYLLEKYKLSGSETIFIDDTDINLITANQVGIRTIKYLNTSQCKYELKEYGCL